MLSLLGTLIVRSGILVSVHAFALDNVRAVPLFSLFALISLASLALYGWRARDGGPAVHFSGLSREMLILATLLLFCAVLLIVLVGTLYPMIYGLLGWGRLSVGAPYFNRATLPFGLLMLVVIVLATFVSGKRVQLPALVAHAGVLLFAAGVVVSSVSRQEISLNLQPGQQVTLAGYTFRFECLDLQAKGNYTSEKAIVALFDHQQRIGELTPERRFYEARRQQMMEPSIRWNGIHDWYAVMGGENWAGSLRFSFVCTKRCALDLGGRIVDDCGRIVKRMAGGRSAMNKGLPHATAVIYLFCARSGRRHLAIRQSATTATGVKYCQPVTLSAVPESKLTGIQRAGGCQYAPSGLQHGGGGEERSRNHWLDDRTLRRFCSL